VGVEGDLAGGRVGITRRTFLSGSTAAGVLAVVARLDPLTRHALARGARLVASETVLRPEAIGARPVITLAVDRDTDLFQADFTFYGFSVDKTSKPPALVATATADSDLWVGVVVQLPPQAIAEADYVTPVDPSSDSDLPFDPTPVLSVVAGPSRLAFTFAHGDRIPLPTMTASDLLDWSDWTLNVQPTAVAGTDATTIREPLPIETAVECPYALYLAPVVPPPPVKGRLPAFYTAFDARQDAFTHRGVTECWTATLTGGSFFAEEFGFEYVPDVAAVWASDYDAETSATFQNSVHILYEEYIAPPQVFHVVPEVVT
jgi:hypothetical protein